MGGLQRGRVLAYYTASKKMKANFSCKEKDGKAQSQLGGYKGGRLSSLEANSEQVQGTHQLTKGGQLPRRGGTFSGIPVKPRGKARPTPTHLPTQGWWGHPPLLSEGSGLLGPKNRASRLFQDNFQYISILSRNKKRPGLPFRAGGRGDRTQKKPDNLPGNPRHYTVPSWHILGSHVNLRPTPGNPKKTLRVTRGRP